MAQDPPEGGTAPSTEEHTEVRNWSFPDARRTAAKETKEGDKLDVWMFQEVGRN